MIEGGSSSMRGHSTASLHTTGSRSISIPHKTKTERLSGTKQTSDHKCHGLADDTATVKGERRKYLVKASSLPSFSLQLGRTLSDESAARRHALHTSEATRRRGRGGRASRMSGTRSTGRNSCGAHAGRIAIGGHPGVEGSQRCDVELRSVE